MHALVSLQNCQNFLTLKLYECMKQKRSGNENSHCLTHTKEEKLMKKFISLFTCLILCFSVCFISNATDTHHSSTASYDLEKGGKQELTLVNSEGCTMYITIEQDTSRTVANGTYKVSARHSNNAWKAGYQVTVKNNTITTLSSPYVDTALGSAQNYK